MSLSLFKTLTIVIIFFLTLGTGFLPIRFAKKYSPILHYGDAFASGVFLGAAFIHLLPDAESSFASVCPSVHYPLAQLVCIITFLILFVLEKGIKNKSAQNSAFHNNNSTAYLLVFLLSIHSLIEGAAIGINTNIVDASLIFFAVIAHKGSESFALSANLNRYSLPIKTVKNIVIFFSFITPLGILFASLTNQLLSNHTGMATAAILNSIAAGTFLYIGITHVLEEKENTNHWYETTALALGITLMSVVAIWI